MTAPGKPVLETARLRLAPLGHADAADMRAFLDDRAVGRFLCDGRPVSAPWVAERITESEARFARYGAGLWTLRLRAAAPGPLAPLIGLAGIVDADTEFPPELLFAVAPRYWHRGLASEATRAILDYAALTLGWSTVSAFADRPNAASLRLLRHLGFTEVTRRAGRFGEIVGHTLALADRPRGGLAASRGADEARKAG